MDNNSEKSLKYIPPKATETDSAKKSDWSVEMAKSITAYKLYVCDLNPNYSKIIER